MATSEPVIVCGRCGAENWVEAGRLGDQLSCGACEAPLRAAPAEPFELDDATFPALLAAAPLPLIVDFWAPWCGPCHAFEPTVVALARRAAGRALVARVNVDECPETAARLGIQSIPTVALFRGGREVARQTGAAPLGALERLVSAA